MSRRFDGHSVVVTGGSRGLGRVIARCFAEEGARVGITYRTRRDDAEETLRLVQEAGVEGDAVQMDVRSPDSVRQAIGRLQDSGPIDVLVNNAAIVQDRHFVMIPAEEWEGTIATNLNGTYHCCRAVIPAMLARRRGAIVNVASVAGLRAVPGQAAYAASKAAVLSLTRTLALETAAYGVRVNAVVPGLLDVGMGQRLDRRIVAQRAATIPMGRLGAGAEVAQAAMFLASEQGSYITGQFLAVDGGLSV
jgi:3-oxoacyl-[acyl-carrier protein] reductase